MYSIPLRAVRGRPHVASALRRLAGAALAVAGAACAPAGRVPAPAPHVAPPGVTALLLPAAPADSIAPLVGVYAAGADTLLLLEDGGRLHQQGPDGMRRPVVLRGDTLRSTARPGAAPLVVQRAADGTPAALLSSSEPAGRFTRVPDQSDGFRIVPQRPVEELRPEALAAAPPPQPDSLLAPDLVELVGVVPGLRLDVRYATTRNFMGARFYDEPRAFLQRPAAQALARVSARLRPLGFGLLVYDAYRPWYVTRMFWDATPPHQRDFVADPANGSRHNRGAAVDLTLYELATGQPVEMPSGYDEFTRRAHASFEGGTARQRALRDLLRRAMEAEGFRVYDAEWWHFDHTSWRRYPVLNLTFDRIAP